MEDPDAAQSGEDPLRRHSRLHGCRTGRRRLLDPALDWRQRELQHLQPGPPFQAITGALGEATSAVIYNDSPTITYTPLAGERFARSIMGSIPPQSIMNVLQAGFPVDVVFRLSVQSINGIDNRRVAGGMSREQVRPANPEFYVLLDQLSRIQNSGDIGVRVSPKGDSLNLVFRRSHSAAVRQAVPQRHEHLWASIPRPRSSRSSLARCRRATRRSRWSPGRSSRSCSTSRRPLSVPETHVTEHRVVVDGGGRSRSAWNDSAPRSGSRVRPNGQATPSWPSPITGTGSRSTTATRPRRTCSPFILLLFTFVETGSKRHRSRRCRSRQRR